MTTPPDTTDVIYIRVPTDDNSDVSEPFPTTEVGETVQQAATDPAQGSDARDMHNSAHLGTGEFAEGCYFCAAQAPGQAVPVVVPDDPPPPPPAPDAEPATMVEAMVEEAPAPPPPPEPPPAEPPPPPAGNGGDAQDQAPGA